LIEIVSDPAHDGGVNVLRDFFARMATLSTISFDGWDFGGPEDVRHLFSAFHTQDHFGHLHRSYY
jgi:hypothetical protein